MASRPSIDGTVIFTVPERTANKAAPGSPLANSVVPIGTVRVVA